MADINDLEGKLAQLGGAVQNLASVFNNASSRTASSTQSVGQGMAKLRLEMQRGAGSASDHARQLRQLQAEYDGIKGSIRDEATSRKMASELNRASTQVMQQTMGDFAGTITKSGISIALDHFKTQVFTTISSLQNNVGGTAAAFAQTNNALNTQIKMLDSLSSSLESATAVLAMLPGWGKAAAGVTAVGAVVANLATGLTKLQQEGVQVLQVEIGKSETAFNAMTASGAQFVQGFAEMRKVSANVRLDLAEMSKFVAANNETLANFGGSVQGGIKRFENASLEMGNFRNELITLGYSYEDQAQGMADYMQIMQQAGQLQQMSDAQLAKGSRDYLVNLRAISAFTGEDVKKAQARAREASAQLAVQSKLQSMGTGAAERFNASIANMEPFMQKAIQQATAFDGTIVDQSLNQLFAMSPARAELFKRTQQDMMDQSLDSAEVTRRYQEYVKELGPAMAAETKELGGSIGAANLAVGALPELTKMLESTMQLGLKGQAAVNSEMPNTVQTTKELATTQDVLRTTTAELQERFKDYQAMLTNVLTRPAEKFAVEGAPGLPGFLANKGLAKQLDDSFGVTIAGLQTIGLVGEEIAKVPQVIRDAAEKISKNAWDFVADAFKRTNSIRLQEPTATPPEQRAGGGVLRGPESGYTTRDVFHGNEAVIPLGSGDTIGVNLRSPSGLIESAIQKAQAQEGLSNRSTETVQTALQTLFNNPNLLSQTMSELKQQLASDNQMSLSLMKQYTDKMDTLIATLDDNNRYAKQIADNIA